MPRIDRQPRQRLDVEVRRQAILQAAAQAFAEHGYPQVSVSGIARQAGASEALVHKYFDGKAGLYAAVLRAAADRLAARQTEADAALAAGVPARDRVRVWLEVYLEHVAGAPTGWSAPFLVAGNDPPAALAVRRAVRAEYLHRLRDLLRPASWPRHDYALLGYFGFLDAACLGWVERGCPAAERDALVEAALGALQGALGDWGR